MEVTLTLSICLLICVSSSNASKVGELFFLKKIILLFYFPFHFYEERIQIIPHHEIWMESSTLIASTVKFKRNTINI